jgi:hypothetical protein
VSVGLLSPPEHGPYDARARRARGDVGGSRREPSWGLVGAAVCVRVAPGSPTARCARCAGLLPDGLHLWLSHVWCYSGANGIWVVVAQGSPRRLPLLHVSATFVVRLRRGTAVGATTLETRAPPRSLPSSRRRESRCSSAPPPLLFAFLSGPADTAHHPTSELPPLQS